MLESGDSFSQPVGFWGFKWNEKRYGWETSPSDIWPLLIAVVVLVALYYLIKYVR